MIKTCVCETVWVETQINLFRIFSGKKHRWAGERGRESQIPILLGQTLEWQEKPCTLTTLCLLQGRTEVTF